MNQLEGAPRPKSETTPPGLAIGIDLGTTNSLIAVVRPGLAADRLLSAPGTRDYAPDGPARLTAELLQLPQANLDGTVAEHTLFPSVVFQASADGPRYVGMGAKEAKYSNRKGKTVFYSVKRDMGTDLDPCYPSAVTPDLDTPVKVSTVILRAMREAAEEKLGISLSNVPTVITIPASFQSAQRRDTLHAAISAGFHVDEHCLFDEPNSALLAYISRPRITARWNTDETVLVFDFGGGTCDISIIEVAKSPLSATLTLKNLGISRYEALGGDDIDKHLVHTQLAQAFYAASRRAERAWGAGERRYSIWSQLYKIAELLKIRMCEELEKVTSSRPEWRPDEFAALSVSVPPQTIKTTEGPITLEDPALTGAQFVKLMVPFLDPSCAGDVDREYYRVTSIFTPILDSLEKARLKPASITRVLLVGGSSLNPLVEQALGKFFRDATIDRPEGLEFLVAEGAALQAHLKFVRRHDVLLPIVGDTIGLLTQGGKFESLIRAGAAIPFPAAEGWMEYGQFRVPRDGMTHVDLVLCAGSANRPIHTIQLRFSKSVPQGAVVRLKVRFDDAKIFRLEADLPDFPGIRVSESITNPLALLPQTPEERRRTELERELTRAQAANALEEHVDDMLELAEVLRNARRFESALEWLQQAQRKSGAASPQLQHQLAMNHHDLGEDDKAHEIWRALAEQDKLNAWHAFNAAISTADHLVKELFLRRAARLEPANGIFRVVLGRTLRHLGKHEEARQQFVEAERLLRDEIRYSADDSNLKLWLAEVLDYLGRSGEAAALRAEARQQPEKAKTVYDNLVELAPQTAVTRREF